MTRIIISAIIAVFSFQISSAQITINSADLTFAGDTFRLSIAAPNPTIDPLATGANHSWDFGFLQSASQRVDSFIDEAATNPLFSFVFIDNALNPNRSNQATRGPSFTIGAFSISDVFNFYYNSSASFKQTGFGAGINGIPLPIAYSPHDIQYRFPLAYGNRDTSNSGYVIDQVSTLGVYIRVRKTRINEVDGWGTLITPYGSFNTIRVKSNIVERDSVYLDTLGFGFNLPPITTNEYKWLGSGYGLPLLQINTGATGAVTQVLYQDSARSTVGIDEQILRNLNFTLYPNPVLETFNLKFELKKSSEVSLEIFGMKGELIWQSETTLHPAGEREIRLNASELNLKNGNYLLRMLVGGRPYYKTFSASN